MSHIAREQLKTGNTFEDLRNKIRQTTYLLYRSKEVMKKVYDNLNKSVFILENWILFPFIQKTAKP